MKTTKKLKWIFLGVSAAMLILGLCLVIWPHFSATALCYLFGGILLINGIARIVSYAKHEVGVFIYYCELPLGLLDLLVAVVFLLHSHDLIYVMPILIGIMLVVDSIFKLQMALDLRRMGMRKWWRLFAFSIVSVLFAFLLVLNPFDGVRAIMIFLGLTLIVASIQSFSLILSAEKYIRKNEPLDADFIEIE